MKTGKKQILLIGICGMGVGPLGIFLSKMGHDVFGYDDYPVNQVMDRLRTYGIRMLEHLHGKHDFDEVIVSRAISHSPERLQRFRTRFKNAVIYFRGEYLGLLSKEFRTVAIAGSHGKTTTTANLIALLHAHGIVFSHILGGYFEHDVLPAANFSEKGDWLIVEVDESDGTIETFNPEISVVTNVELDHVDHYPTEDLLKRAFLQLMERSQQKVWVGYKASVALGLNPSGCKDRIVVLPASEHADFVEENEKLAEAVGTAIVGKPAGNMKISFPSVERRQECQRIGDRIWVLSDYAHHPGEIRALQKWIEQRFSEASIHWIFQPHRYTRTVALKEDFVNALTPLNPCLLPEYGAFEPLIEAGTSDALHRELRRAGSHSIYCQSPKALWDQLDVSRDDAHVFLFAGAGDIVSWKDWFVHALMGQITRQMIAPDFDSTWLSFHAEKLANEGSYFAVAEPLKRKTTMNVGGTARLYAEPASLEGLQLVLKTSKMHKLSVHLLGRGSNLLIRDTGVDGVVVRLSQAFWKKCEYLGDGRFWVGAGLSSKRMCKLALDAGVDGFSFLDGIPGTIGGAVCMNAGAMGTEIAERVVEVECLDVSGKRIRLSRDELGFSYRHCKAVEDLIVLHVLLEGDPHATREELMTTLELYRQKRLSSQPADPSAGCMFLNPVGDSAGRLIDLAGLKGFSIGGASVSSKHGNFLITGKDTRSDDVEAVLRHVALVVKTQFGIELQREIITCPASDHHSASSI